VFALFARWQAARIKLAGEWADTRNTPERFTMDMNVSSALLADRVLQSRQGQTAQQAQLLVMKKAMDMQQSASAALLSAVAGDLPLAKGGALGTQLNTLA
jgi:hypothetical protein